MAGLQDDLEGFRRKTKIRTGGGYGSGLTERKNRASRCWLRRGWSVRHFMHGKRKAFLSETTASASIVYTIFWGLSRDYGKILQKITKSCFLWEQTAACNSRRAVCITGGGWKLTSASWKQRSQPEKQQQQQQR